ncbi:MAG: DUF4476 domain-containing protein [Bacteroidales bacterium]|nr:DUF4476 domain-containing protein [Bacteroidales bacterium]
MGLIKAIVKALRPKTNKTIGINSPSGIRFWVYIDNILQNQHSEISLLIYDIPVNDDATSTLEVTLDLGNGNIAKIPGQKLKLTSTAKYFTINASGKKPALKSTSSFVAQTEVKCAGVKPEIDYYEEYVPPTPRKKPAAKKTTTAKPKAEKAAPASSSMFCTESKFQELIDVAKEYYLDDERKAAIRKIISTNNLRASQLTELVETMYYEDDKFELLKYAYTKSNDKKNFSKALTLLRKEENREYFLKKMGKAKKTTTTTRTASKPKAKSAIDEYIEAVNAFYSQSDKKAAIEHIITSNKLTATQIKQLVNIMASQHDKLELLEFAYPYCKDKNNYIKTVSILASIHDRNKILEMIG